jgi:hypothetical protein
VDQVGVSSPVMKYGHWNNNKRPIPHNDQIQQMDRMEIMERASRDLGPVLLREAREKYSDLCINSLWTGMFNMNFVVLCCGFVVFVVVLCCVECYCREADENLLCRCVLVFLVWFG